MGQKVNPNGIRLGFIRNWSSIWYANSKDYAQKLNKDIEIRSFLLKSLSNAYISNIIIERPSQNAKITIFTSRPGIIIGKKGEEIEILRKKLSNIINIPVQISIEEIKKPEIDARLVSVNIANQLEKRIIFRRVMKRSVQTAMKLGAKGIKVSISGRLGGAEIARTEWSREGRIPLHTFRANIDYAFTEALTNYGILGVKVWIFKGELFLNKSHKKTDINVNNDKKRRGLN